MATIDEDLDLMSGYVKIGKPTYHKKRKYFTMKATGDIVHEINLDYISYPLIPIKNEVK